jgi:hypothetical protein
MLVHRVLKEHGLTLDESRRNKKGPGGARTL